MQFSPRSDLSRRDVYLALGCMVLLIGVAAVSIFFSGVRERERVLSAYQTRLGYVTQTRSAILHRETERMSSGVLFLTKTPPVGGVARAMTSGGYDALERSSLELWIYRLNAIFSAYAETNPTVYQVRLIEVAHGGRELVRIDRDNQGRVIQIPQEQLLQKGDREYFHKTVGLRAGQVYLSEIYYHHVHGKLQVPYVPVMRVATPVFGPDGKLFGMVTLTFNVSYLLESLKQNIPVELRIYLTNKNGDYLLQPDATRTFGFVFGKHWRWQDEFHAVSAGLGQPATLQGYDTPLGKAYARVSNVVFNPANQNSYNTLIVALPEEAVADAELSAQSATVQTIVLITLIMTMCAYLYIRKYRQVIEKQSELSSIVESSHDAIIGKTLHGVVTSWNAGAERILGYRADEAIGKSIVSLIVPPNAFAEEEELLARAGRGEFVEGFDTVRHRKDGSLLDVSVTVSPIHAADGHIVGASKTIRDISAQKAAEAHIRSLNASLERQVEERTAEIRTYSAFQQAILNNAGYAIIATDTDGLITLFNPAAERMLGYRADELIGKETPYIFHDVTEIAEQAMEFSIELGEAVDPTFDVLIIKSLRGRPNEHNWTYVRQDGSRFPVQLTVSLLKSDEGVANGYLFIAADITLREQDRRNLESVRDQLTSAVKIAELGIWAWHPQDNAVEWNERMFEIYGLPLSLQDRGLNYKDWFARVHPEDADATIALLMGAVDGTNTFDTEFRIIRLDGSLRYLQAAAQIERDALGNAIKVQGINRDITLQREQEAVLRAAKVAADAANRAKSEFLANMSHEIRTPMNAILGMLQLMQQTSLDDRQLDYVGKAESAARTLLGILNDILDFSRVEAGKLELDPNPFSIDTALRDIGVILASNVGGKDVELLYEIDPALPEWVVADSLRLSQVLINLAGNAIKFTEHGEVVLSAQLIEQDQSRLTLGFAVRDTGIGISPEQCQRIFEGFSQAEASTARRYGGSGLGLAISQRLVNMMGGTLSVASVLGEGSTFSFTITCERTAPPERVQVDSQARMHELTCLVVDDNESARQLLSSTLGSFGWQVECVGSGAEALMRVEQSSAQRGYDVIFVDWKMPGMDGWETCERIRQLQRDKTSPLIVMVTAYGREQLAERLRHAPGLLDGFLVKPITPSMLFDVVADASASRGRVLPNVNSPSVVQQRLAGLKILVVEDNPTNQQVAKELLSSEGARIEVSDGGRLAIEMALCATPPYDVVLMDIQMPDMDGYAATRALRETFEQDALPIIAMTANVMPADREEALAAGMNAHVGKPFDLSELVDVILRYTGRHASIVVEPDGTPLKEGIVPELLRPGLNGTAALVRFGGNLKIYQRALHSFATESGLLAASLPTSVSDESQQGALQALHTLKGLAATVGAEELAEAAARAERVLRNDQGNWSQAQSAVMSARLQACRAATALVEEIEGDLATADATPTPSAQADLKDDLIRLKALLDAANLDALEVFNHLQQRYSPMMPKQFAQLEQAIERMEFSVASHHCIDILQHCGMGQT